MFRFKFDEEKAIASVLFLSRGLIALKDRRAKTDFHKIFKILYFADQKHMARYGRPIVGDSYIAMGHGPVPSRIYDIFKAVRGDGDSFNIAPECYIKYFEIKRGCELFPKQDPDIDVLAPAELDSLMESFNENKFLSFNDLKDKSHDRAYCRAAKDDKIPFQTMAEVGGADLSMIAYMRDIAENERILGR